MSKMVENLIARVNYEEAKVLADLGSITQDLGFTMRTCSRLKNLLQEKSEDDLLIENLWTAALIRYARCFASGKRFGLAESIFDGLKGEPHKVHKMYIDLRNKHTAHSVNPFEQMEVGLILTPLTDNERKIVGVEILSMHYMCPNIEGVHQLGLLAKVLLKKVCELAKQYEKRVLEKGQSIPIDELYKCARPILIVPGPESADKPRL